MKTKRQNIVSALCVAGTVTAFADVVITKNVTLTEDTDWSNEKVVFDPGASVYLEGHELKVSDISITNKFIEMEYFETDGNQWFVLPEAPACTDTVEMKLKPLSATDNQCFFCTRTGSKSNTYTLIVNNKKLRMDFGSSQETYSDVSLDINDVITFRVKPGSDNKASVSIISADGVTTNVVDDEIGSGSAFTPPTPFWLFKLNTNGAGVNGYNAKCRFYSFKTWNIGGDLKNDVVPVYNVKEKKVYLYDRVSKTYLANQGTADSTGNGYCRLDCVDCKKFYIVDSGFTPACTNRIEIKARCVNRNENQLLFNSRYAAAARAFSAWVLKTGKFRFDYGSKQSSEIELSFDEDHVFVMSPGADYTATITVDGEIVATIENGASFDAFKALGVCGGTGGMEGTAYSSGMYGYFYYMKVYASDESDAALLCDLVPAYGLKEKSIGMFDRVAQTFRTNCIPNSTSPSMDGGFLSSNNAGQGTLNICVPPDTVVTNDAFSIRGKINVIKDGEGTLVAANTNQTYTGGFVVTNGTAMAMPGLGSLFGSAGKTITVAEGAVFDFNGSKFVSPYPIRLNGGKLMNSGGVYGSYDISLKTVTLGADSYWDSSTSLGFYGGDGVFTKLDLGGYTLYVTNNSPSDAVFRLTNTTITNGTLVVSGDGIIMMRGGQGVAYGATLDLNGQLCVCHKITYVGNLILRDGCTVYVHDELKNFSVAGTFTCETTNGFPKVVLEPGSTWDLSENEGTFNTVNPLNSSWNVMMADGEKGQSVNIKLGNRAVSSARPIVSWTNADYTNVTYKIVDTAYSCRLSARADGLYVRGGLTLVIR